MVKHCKYHFRSHWIDCFDKIIMKNTAWYFEHNAEKQEIVNAVYVTGLVKTLYMCTVHNYAC